MITMTTKIFDPIFDNWKKYLNSVNSISFVNWIFISGLIILLCNSSNNKIDIKIANLNVTEIAINLNNTIYSFAFVIFEIILSIVLIAAIILVCEKAPISKSVPTFKLTTGKTISYKATIAVSRIYKFNFWYLHNIWVILFFINVLHNPKFFSTKILDSKFDVNVLIFIINIFIIFFSLINSLFCVEIIPKLYGDKIDYNFPAYVKIAHTKLSESEFLILKKTTVEPNLFLLGKRITSSSPYKVEIINYSKNFDEIKYQFNELKN